MLSFTFLINQYCIFRRLYSSYSTYYFLSRIAKSDAKLSFLLLSYRTGFDTIKAAEFNNIPYPILLNYWKKRISAVLQIGNVSIISEAYRRLFNFGADRLQRDYDLERAFD